MSNAQTKEIEVLVLDDSEDDRDNMDLLFKEDAEVGPYQLFSNSRPFLAKARRLRKAVLVIDYKLSEGPTGLDVLRDLMEDDEDEFFYTIIHTGYPDIKMMLDFLKLRPWDFVIKGDGEQHYLNLIAAIKRGRHRIERRLEHEAERNRKIDTLMAMAEGFTKPINTDDNDRSY